MTPIDESAAAVTRRRRFSKGRARAGRMFVAPNLAAVAVFMLFPLGFSLYMSLQNWDLFRPAKFVGLANYRSLFTGDPLFVIALRNTVVYTVGTVVPTILISLAVAGVLNRKIKGIRYLSDDYLSAPGRIVGGDGRRLAVRLQHQQRSAQHHAGLDRDRPNSMAG